jgi:hypothetical protein
VTVLGGASTIESDIDASGRIPMRKAPETVILTVSDGATYDVGAPAAATGHDARDNRGRS